MSALKIATAALCLVGLAACGPSTDQVDVEAENITYFRDQSTKLCFAALSVRALYTDTITLTYVPCTEEVLRHLR